MVKYTNQAGSGMLDRTFAALADPTRRELLARLSSRDGLSISELAEPFAMSLPAVMKHLDVLTDAGLVAREKTGRVVACRLTAAPMREALAWLNRYERFWSDNLDRLTAFVEEETCLQHPTSPNPSRDRASYLSVASTRRPKRSLPPGPTRKK
jgi:DNA-binding transcriptional ArsR family regulator